MAHPDLSHRRTHNLLLISKLLSQKDIASPFTLVLDSLEQSARYLLREYVSRAKISKCYTIFLSFETLKVHADIDAFIPCHNSDPQQILRATAATVGHISSSRTLPLRILIVIDALTTLATLSAQSPATFNLPAYLSSLLALSSENPLVRISLVAVHHTEVTLLSPSSPYSPPPLALLSYLATTIMNVHSLAQVLADKVAREQSLQAPFRGLNEEVEGVVIGLSPKSQRLKREKRGIVIELEHRRKSGRSVHETYFLPTSDRSLASNTPASRESVILLDDHPLYRKQPIASPTEDELAGLTFELGLTDRQKHEREGVVLPYFDAQQAGGGEGGRILYDMGVEDDFDDEEDEI